MAKNDKPPARYIVEPNETHILRGARRLLQDYSKIPADQILAHVVSVRDKAWNVFPYPCIGQLHFVNLGLNKTAEYKEIVARVQSGQRLLDMACCFGQEIRQLVVDGCPAENLYGCDLYKGFIDLGYELFRDRDRLRSTFIAADVFDEASELSTLNGTMDIIYVGSFFHLFNYKDQMRAGRQVARLLKPVPGSLVVGRQLGSIVAGERQDVIDPTQTIFRHTPESLQSMWNVLGKEMDATFLVQAAVAGIDDDRFDGDNEVRWLTYTVRRV